MANQPAGECNYVTIGSLKMGVWLSDIGGKVSSARQMKVTRQKVDLMLQQLGVVSSLWSRAVSDNLWISSEAGATGFVQENCDLPASNQCSTPITPIIPCHQIVAKYTRLYNTVLYYTTPW